jgi:hypothetical protein
MLVDTSHARNWFAHGLPPGRTRHRLLPGLKPRNLSPGEAVRHNGHIQNENE